MSVQEQASEDSFRLLRIRLLRPPPAVIQLPSGRGVSFSLELAVGLQDDYGVDAVAFESVKLRLEVLDTKTSARLQKISVALNLHPDPSRIELATARGPFHQLKITVTLTDRPQSYPRKIRFRLCRSSPEVGCEAAPSLSTDSARMLELLGEPDQRPLAGWDDHRYVLISAMSGDVTLASAPPSKTPQTVPSDKVQTLLRTVHLPSLQHSSSTFTIIERPGLNNSTGQRLWDCAIALTCYLSLHPTSLLPSPPTSSTTGSNKRPKLDGSPPLTCVELGAGCALTSLATAALLHPSEPSSITIASDVGATFSTTLQENIDANPSHRFAIRPAILDWGHLERGAVLDFLAVDGRSKSATRALTILGSDILYNPESHEVLLKTLMSFLGHPKLRASQALIAYKPRTEGDGDFFPLAEKAGLVVEKVWTWGELGVYRLTRA